eukprot:TRINITY_DN2526_c0_g1_i2.p1 TRINITY_DN2526_c0_g1~~TRINITY_DN2526_c0_g1_i2.p1  ORF type:complete len:269 (-),score=87.62 TRINITY_DN2526_c0_g1_i2:230-1036(-)
MAVFSAPRPTMGRRSRTQLLPVAAAATAGLWACGCFVPAPGRTPQYQHETVDGAAYAVAAAASATSLVPSEAWAKDGAWGPMEGKVNSLVHPAMMAALFLVTLTTGYYGLQWRKVRELGDEIKELKAGLPATESEDGFTAAQKDLQAKVDALSTERKELVAAKFKEQHQNLSSLLLGGGIFFTAYGIYNTWMRTEKLFPGPHLYAGSAIVVLWALAAALVPAMEKGNTAARNAHIALATLNVGLFIWQIPTGLEITFKVLGNEELPLF